MIRLMKITEQTDLINTLDKLVGFKTVNSNITEKNKCIDYLHDEFKSLGLKVKKYHSNGYPSLVATTQVSSHPKVLLQGHVDVVPANNQLFSLVDSKSKLAGRGVYDMKFAVACYLQLAKELKDSLNTYDFGIMLTSDEEIGGENGVGYLLEQGFSAEVCFLPDGGDNWKLESECNGVWLLDIVANGKTAHGSRPWEGDNAIDKLIDTLSEIKRVFPMDQSDKNTITISKLQGGTAINQVPAEAKCTIDMRFTDQASYTKKRIQIESIIQKKGLTVETRARLDSISLDVNETHIKDFINIASKVYGKSIEFGRSYGASDAHYFSSKGIPTILIRPNGGGAHSDEEWIEKDGLNTYFEVVKAYVKEAAKIA